MTTFLRSPDLDTLIADLITAGINCQGWDITTPLVTDCGILEYVGRIPIPLTEAEEEANYQAFLADEPLPYEQEYLAGIHVNIYKCSIDLPVFSETEKVYPSIPYRKILSYE